LIYTSISTYLAAFLMALFGQKRAGHRLFAAGFVIALICLLYRWFTVGHVPLQNLFEVFLTMGVVVWPLSLFCRKVLRVGAESPDMLIGVIVLIPAGFIFSGEPRYLPPALQCRLFAPHVAVYILSYIIMTKAAVQAVILLALGRQDNTEKLIALESNTYRIICLGFPLMTLGLVLGSYWAKLAWGDYWGWDPKEMWSLAAWLVYAGYFYFRGMYGAKYARINSLWAIAGMVLILLTLFWANLSRLFVWLHSYA